MNQIAMNKMPINNGVVKQKAWVIFCSISLIAGLLLRLLFVEDMEYKEDEEYNFTQTQLIGNTQPWPWYGIPSGVYIVNPGMSIWVFTILAKLFRIHTPTGLAHAVQLFAILGMSLILPFAWRWIRPDKAGGDSERKLWLWAFALAMVNPFLVLYQRKLWPEPFLPFFSMLMWIGWWKRDSKLGAFVWGLAGACIGQVHMSGFFLAAGLLVWEGAVQIGRRTARCQAPTFEIYTKWRYWFAGSVLGALPLIPWFVYIVTHPVNHAVSTGWSEAIQLKYWVFWFTNPLGLHLGNPLGLLRGPSHWDQLSDFIRYPIVFGHATYLVGVAHLIAAGTAVLIFVRWFKHYISQRGGESWEKNVLQNCSTPKKARMAFWGKGQGHGWPLQFWRTFFSQDSPQPSNTAFLQNSAFWACGILMTITGVMIRRYYMAATFPLEFIFLARMALPMATSAPMSAATSAITSTSEQKSLVGHRLLMTLWVCELCISANFVGYIHVNHGSTMGDYGSAYHLIKKEFS